MALLLHNAMAEVTMSRNRQRARQHTTTTPTLEAPGPDLFCGSNAAQMDALVVADVEAEDSFLGGLDTSFGAAVDDHRTKLTTDDDLSNRSGDESFPKRWEGGSLRVPRPAQRELHAEVQQPDGSYGPIDLDTHSMDETDPESTYRSWYDNGKDCALATYASLKAMGYESPRGDKNSILRRGEIGDVRDGELEGFDPEAAKKILDAIDGALLDGVPVMVGVDYPGEQKAENADGVTDHWLLVTGREYDGKTGEVRYQAMDNATADAPTRYFTVGEDYGLTSPPPEGAMGAAAATYSLTNARVPERSQ